MSNFNNDSKKKLEEVADVVKALPGKHEAVEAEALLHQNQLTKPPGALGRLEELAVFLASWQGKVKPPWRAHRRLFLLAITVFARKG